MSQSAWIYNYGEMCGGVRAWRVGCNDPVLTKLVLGCHLVLLSNFNSHASRGVALTLMRRAMEFQRLGSSLRVHARKATGIVLLVESFISDSLRQSSNSAGELIDRFLPFLAQAI